MPASNPLQDFKKTLELIITDDYYYKASPEVKRALQGAIQIVDLITEKQNG